jgi:hypothetical protein
MVGLSRRRRILRVDRVPVLPVLVVADPTHSQFG